MFDLSPEKILFLGVIAIMVLGPDRLPKAARTAAKVLHQIRTATGSLQDEMRDALAEPRQAINDAVGDLGIPTDLGLPRIPTARGLVSQVLSPSPSRADDRARAATSVPEATTVEGSSPGPTPDDPSLN